MLYLSLLALAASVAYAVTPVVISGSDFVDSVTRNRVSLVGVAYQPGGQSGYNPGSGIDPLSNGDVCLRDAALMQRLGVNAIRVYNVDPDLNHDLCASIFNAVGIYMLLDVNSPLAGESLDRSAPWNSYYAGYVNRTFAVVEAFKSYPNTLLFFAGNEVVNDVPTGSTVPPYLRAITRDLKGYVAKHASRPIPVGYSAADVRDNLLDQWNYVQCTTTGDSSDLSRADLFALNSYSWCGGSSYTTSGYDVLVSDFGSSSVPVFFSEYGCNVPAPRVFTEVPVLYGPQMTGVLDGGMVYEYSQETSDYGLVTLNADGSAQLLPDYDTLQSQFRTLNITALQSVPEGNSSATPPACVSSLITSSGFNKNFTQIPDPPGVAALIKNGINPKPTGKIVSIPSTTVKQQVKDSQGGIITSLAITPLADDQSNNPGTSTTSSAPAATTTKKHNAGESIRVSFALLVSAASIAVLLL